MLSVKVMKLVDDVIDVFNKINKGENLSMHIFAQIHLGKKHVYKIVLFVGMCDDWFHLTEF